jgi:hypothetical protein
LTVIVISVSVEPSAITGSRYNRTSRLGPVPSELIRLRLPAACGGLLQACPVLAGGIEKVAPEIGGALNLSL